MKELRKRIKAAGMCVVFLIATTATACSNQKKAANSMISHETEVPVEVPVNQEYTIYDGSGARVTRALMDALSAAEEDSDDSEESDEEIQYIEQHVVDTVRQAAPPTQVTTTETIAPMEPMTRYVNTWSLNIRSGPGINNSVIGYKLYGTEVTILYVESDGTSDWGKIQVDDTTIGYISMDYLSKDPLVEYMGEFIVTYYCPCPQCCGRWSRYGKTASGTTPTQGRTIATDGSIPFGTRLIVDGVEYVVEDRGSGIVGNRIDIYLDSHSACYEHAVEAVSVFKEL